MNLSVNYSYIITLIWLEQHFPTVYDKEYALAEKLKFVVYENYIKQ